MAEVELVSGGSRFVELQRVNGQTVWVRDDSVVMVEVATASAAASVIYFVDGSSVQVDGLVRDVIAKLDGTYETTDEHVARIRKEHNKRTIEHNARMGGIGGGLL